MGYPLRWDVLAIPPVIEEQAEKSVARPTPRRGYFVRLAALTLLGSALFMASVVGISRLFLNDGLAPSLRLESISGGATVPSAAPKVIRKLGFVAVTGRLANGTSRPLDRLEAVVDLMDRDGRIVRSGSALVERDRVAPGQETAFQVDMPDEPRAAAYRIRYKTLLGPDLK